MRCREARQRQASKHSGAALAHPELVERQRLYLARASRVSMWCLIVREIVSKLGSWGAQLTRTVAGRTVTTKERGLAPALGGNGGSGARVTFMDGLGVRSVRTPDVKREKHKEDSFGFPGRGGPNSECS